MPKFDDEELQYKQYAPQAPEEKVNYKFSEDKIHAELKTYIDSTYNQHYARTKFQATEFIFDNGHGEGFCLGNIMKYAQRYGKKDGRNKKDLMKILHYAIMAVHVHNQQEELNKVFELPPGADTITISTDSNQGTLNFDAPPFDHRP